MTHTKTNLNAKAILARLMAAEDLTVDIDSSAPTASFNLVERKLTLPLWEVGDEAYNMLVGHEVSHALYTPTGEALAKACEAIDPKAPGVARDYINVVEDARIERLIKTDYPGLRRSFSEGYQEFIKSDIFGVKGKDIATLALIDRINLHYKIGWKVEVPFKVEELALVRKVAETRSWEDVVSLSKALYDLAKQQKQEQQEQEQQQGQGQGQKTEQGEESEPSEQGEKPEQTEQGDESSSKGSMGEEDGQSESQSANADGQDDGQDDGQSQTEAEGEQGEQGEQQKGNTNTKPAPTDTTPDGASTLRSMEQGLERLVNNTDRIVTNSLPTELPENFVLPLEWTERVLTGAMNWRTLPDALFGEWKKTNSGDVQALWSEFERRKAADAHRRAMVNDTGIIDPLRLVHYKTSDDIFLSNTTIRDGKNHGIVLFLDMSGSMCDKIFPTMYQIINFAAFARRANIPFTVYGFGDKFGSNVPPMGKWSKGWESLNSTSPVSNHAARLVTLLESGMTQARFVKTAGMLIGWAASYAGSNRVPSGINNAFKSHANTSPNGERMSFMSVMDMGATPTNTALIAAHILVPQFKTKHRLQVVNTVVLTDGGASDVPFRVVTPAGEYARVIVRDPVTRREYRTFESEKSGNYTYNNSFGANESQHLLAQMLRDRTGGHVMGIAIVENNHRIEMMMKVMGLRHNEGDVALTRASLKEKEFAKFTTKTGYDTIILLPMDGEDEDTEKNWDLTQADVNDKKSLRNLSKNFIKSLEAKRSNRPLMGQIAEVIASNLS